MELTPIQLEVLNALIDLHHQKRGCIKGEEIAMLIGRNPGTVRNQMQSLKALRLVEGVPGPKGGYKPTTLAYDELSIQDVEKEAVVPIKRDGEPVEGATVLEISFTTVHHPHECHGTARMLGNIKLFEEGDTIEIGPTPVNGLILRGRVIDRDDVRSLLLFDIDRITTLPKGTLSECPLSEFKIGADTPLRDAAALMAERCEHAAMVERDGKVVGVVELLDIARALANNGADSPVSEVMREPIWADATTPMLDVLDVLTSEREGAVLVEQEGKCLGLLDCRRLISSLGY
ncbi:MAG: transcriptional regulator [Methanosarcinales archaeon]|nr:transcriptional regulator [Methanosarcinales archaeon]